MNPIFAPEMLRDRPIHIAGCGSLGSKEASTLYSKNVPEIHLWDDDTVEERNLFNQRFFPRHIGALKVDAIPDYCASIYPGRTTRFVLHKERVSPSSALDGIVLCCVDSMSPGRESVFAAVQNSGSVSFFADGRVGEDGGMAFGLDPRNDEHAYRYTNPPHWYQDPEDQAPGCKTVFPQPEMSDLVAAHVLWRLTEWLHREHGRGDPYMNFIGWSFMPTYLERHEYWDLAAVSPRSFGMWPPRRWFGR